MPSGPLTKSQTIGAFTVTRVFACRWADTLSTTVPNASYFVPVTFKMVITTGITVYKKR